MRLARLLFRLVKFTLLILLIAVVSFRLLAFMRENDVPQALAPNNGTFVETPTGSIFTLQYGKASDPPLLFLHGTGAWSGLWEPTLQHFANQHYRAIALDLPPFGFSERPEDQDYSLDAQAKRILSFVDTMQIKPILVAHSFGAAPGVEAVMARQDAFAGLIVVDGALGLGQANSEAKLPLPLRPRLLRDTLISASATNPFLTKFLLKQLIAKKPAATDEIVAILQKPMRLKGSTTALSQWLPFLLLPGEARSNRAANYKALRLPVAYLWGEADQITPLAQANNLVDLTPNAKLTILKNVGHIPQIEDANQFNTALAKILKQSPLSNQ